MGILRNADGVGGQADGQPLSPTLMNQWGAAVRALDEATRLGGVAFCGGYGQHPEEADEPSQYIWQGGLVFLTGMTTLRISYTCTGTVRSGDTLRIYRGDDQADGSLPATYSDLTIASGAQSQTITISGWGYSHEQIIRLRAYVIHSLDPSPPYDGCIITLHMVEAYPVTYATAWPGLPTFSSAADITGANLTLLASAINWLIVRCSLRYDPLFILQIRRIGPFCIPSYGTNVNVQWRGAIRKTPLHATLTAIGRTKRAWAGATEYIRLYVNGSLVSTHTVPTSVGESAWSLTADMSGYTNGDIIPIRLEYVRTAPEQDGTPINRWTINSVSVAAPTSGDTPISVWDVRQASAADSAILTWLQTLVTVADACYDRIADNSGFWYHQRAFTHRPAFDAGQSAMFEEWSPAATWGRAGDAIAVRGRGVTLGYSAGYLDEAAFEKQAKTNDGVGSYPLINLKTATVLDGDNIDSTEFWLDTAPGLAPGDPYNLRGVELYVALERLKAF